MNTQATAVASAPIPPMPPAYGRVLLRIIANLLVVLGFGLAFSLITEGDKETLKLAIRKLVDLRLFEIQLVGVGIVVGIFLVLWLASRHVAEKERIRKFLSLVGDEFASLTCTFGSLLVFASFTVETLDYLWYLSGNYAASFVVFYILARR